METLTGYLVVFGWLFFVFLSCVIGYNKNRAAFGLYLGLVLGPISCVVMLFVDEREGEPHGVFHALGALIAAAMRWGLFAGVVWTITWSDREKERMHAENVRAEADRVANATREEIERQERNVIPAGGLLAHPQDLFSIKGDVVRVTPEGIVIRPFVSTYNPANYMGRLPANAGAGDISRLADLAIREQDGVGYGDLQKLERGRLVPVRGDLPAAPGRQVLLHGYPHQVQPGAKLHVLAARLPDGQRYTMDYVLEGEPRPVATPVILLTGPRAVPRATPSAAEQNAEILRKYGTR
jgi:hypothetical protein